MPRAGTLIATGYGAYRSGPYDVIRRYHHNVPAGWDVYRRDAGASVVFSAGTLKQVAAWLMRRDRAPASDRRHEAGEMRPAA